MEGLYTNAVITNAGKALRDAAVYEQIAFQFTRFAIGNGTYTAAEKTIEAMEVLTGLKSEKNEYSISNITVTSPSKVKLEFLITNFDPNTGESIVPVSYTANEIGLFAKQDGSDEEILYSLAVCQGDAGDAINTYNGNNPLQVQETYSEKVGNASLVTIDLTSGFATATALESEIEARRQSDFEILYDLGNKTTTIGEDNGDKLITEVDSDREVTTVTRITNTSPTVKTITTTITPDDGDYYWTKVEVITTAESGKTITKTTTKSPKE